MDTQGMTKKEIQEYLNTTCNIKERMVNYKRHMCYENVMKFVLQYSDKIKDIVVYHGTVEKTIKYGHAWLQVNGTILDFDGITLTWQLSTPEEFNTAFRPTNVKTFSVIEYCKNIATIGHCGPWQN